MEAALQAALTELERQQPDYKDFSEEHGEPVGSVVMSFDAFNMRLVVEAILATGALDP